MMMVCFWGVLIDYRRDRIFIRDVPCWSDNLPFNLAPQYYRKGESESNFFAFHCHLRLSRQTNRHPKTPQKYTPARHIGHLISTGFSHAGPAFLDFPSFHGSSGARSDRESMPSPSVLSMTIPSRNNCFTEPVKKIHGRRT